MTEKYILIDADVETFDTPEAAMAAVVDKDGHQRLYKTALLLKAEIVHMLRPSAQATTGDWGDVEAKRRDQMARYSDVNSAKSLAGGGGLIGRGIN